MTNIIETWERHERRQGRNLKESLALLNAATGRKYNHGRIAQWRKGELSPPHEAVRWMALQVIEDVLSDLGMDARLDSEGMKKLVYSLTAKPKK